MAFAVRHGWLLLGMLAVVGCSNSVDHEPTAGLDSKMPDNGGATVGGSSGGGSGAAQADACSTAASWQANAFRFDTSGDTEDFARAMNALLKVQTAPAISVSNYMTPHCVWMVAFSAADATSAGTDHAATYTEMFRHPAGLWTAAPQANGWIRVVDAAAHTVWIPIANVTGSANFGSSDCSAITTADALAVIPKSAATLPITTSEGTTTLGDLLGKKTSKDGWQVGFSFSGDAVR